MSKMCVFCLGVYESDVVVCPECNDYKGMTPLGEAITYLDLDPNDYPEVGEV